MHSAGLLSPVFLYSLTFGLSLLASVSASDQGTSNCQASYAVSVNEWNQLGMDDYLEKIPNGKSLSLKAYIESLGIKNVECKFGGSCDIPIPCNFKRKDGIVLYAAEQLVSGLNTYQSIIGDALKLARDELVFLLKTLDIPRTSQIPNWFVNNIKWAVSQLLMTLMSDALTHELAKQSLDALTFEHTYYSKWKWDDLAQFFDTVAPQIQAAIPGLQVLLDQGISTPTGIYTLLQGGQGLALTQGTGAKQRQESLSRLSDPLKLSFVVFFLRASDAFVVRKQFDCDGKGKNGAWTGRDTLSHCGEDKVMTNVFLAQDDTAVMQVKGIDKVMKKYHLNVRDIVTRAVACTHPTAADEHSFGCVAFLPVCDFADPALSQKKQSSTVKTCREFGLEI